MQKRVDEIARVLCDAHEPCKKCVWSRCNFGNMATRLYNAGYRKQEWISVEERLPEKNYHDFVLAWNGLHVEFLHYNHRYKQWEDYYSLKEHPWKVTHWMPLPSAPKGE